MHRAHYTVLLIEDNDGDARLIEKMLEQIERTHFTVVHLRRLEDGLRTLRERADVDIGLLDLSLPDSHGVATFIEAYDAAEDIPWIVLTGTADEEMAMSTVSGGAQDYLVKDQINADSIGRSIRYAINRKRAEREKLELRQRLSRAERLETAGTVLGQAAHDYGNLLLPLRLAPALIRESLPADSRAHQYVDILDKIAKEMSNLNRDILTLTTRGRLEEIEFDLNDQIRQVLDAMQFDDTAPAIRINTELGEELLTVMGSPGQMNRVLQNLIHNAVDAMDGDGVLSVTSSNVYLDRKAGEYATIARGEYALVTVSDSGCGMPDDVRERVFDPFFSTKKGSERSGTGLGLSIVHGVIKDHSGHIDLTSTEGHGTTFKLYLPSARLKTLSIAPPSSNNVGDARHVLIVDDDRHYVEMIRQVILKQGMDATAVTSGEDALAFLASHHSDLVLMDVVMPGLDGIATCRRLREIRPHQRVIFMSGTDDDASIDTAQRLSNRDLLHKPFHINVLKKIVIDELPASQPDGSQATPALTAQLDRSAREPVRKRSRST
ncbi:MAG: response regulator [Verrucomicrobia bacterium]|nr:response regulator [Verrucomicrobiota bacterium]MDA1086173.1 response regulator [Verrucomicrobiota bacterium]